MIDQAVCSGLVLLNYILEKTKEPQHYHVHLSAPLLPLLL